MGEGREKARILVADDSTTIAAMAREYLEAEGYAVEVARDGLACIQALPSFSPDLLLLDIIMPGLDGWETCARIKADPAWKELPVIFMSSLSSGEDKAKAFGLGAGDYVTKPIDRAELLARVHTHLKASELRRRELALNEELERGIANRTAELEAALEEKTALLKEINHRVMNNLQVLVALISQQMADLEDEGPLSQFRELRDRVRAMAFVYGELEAGGSLSTVGLKPFLENLVSNLAEGPSGYVPVECVLDELALDISRAMPFGLAANELVAAALALCKPTGPGTKDKTGSPAACRDASVRVRLAREGSLGRLSVEGPAGAFAEFGALPSIGRTLVRLLADQLGGRLGEAKDSGSRVELTFPVVETDP